MRRVSEGPGWRSLEARAPEVPRDLARKFVAKRKKKARMRERLLAEASRRSITVTAPGAVKTLDALHSGRTADATAIEAHILRDRASLMKEAAIVGTAMTAEDFTPRVIDLIERRASMLVLQTDNGSLYKNFVFRLVLRRLRIVPYLSEPRTPQHNPVAEEGMRELRAFIPKGNGAHAVGEAASLIEHACFTINTTRPRLSRGGLTSAELHRVTAPQIDRYTFYREVLLLKRRFRREAAPGPRARRRADRRAVEQALVNFGLATVRQGVFAR